jgi:hypothetical protein
MLLWHRLASGSLPLPVVIWTISLLTVSLMLGDLFQKYISAACERTENLPTKLLIGFLLVNIILFFSHILIAIHLTVAWILLVVGTASFWFYSSRTKTAALIEIKHPTEAIFFLTIPLLVTVWLRELLSPIQINGDVAVVRAWQDVFYHLCQINAFASSSGLATMSDVQMVGAPVQPYHLASYMLAATLVNATGSSSLVAYTSVLVPLGMTMTGLAAYSLGRAVFGSWPALACSLAIMLLPDATQQGAGNPFFGFQWLQQIAPAQSYGLASAALVFVFIFEACRTLQYRNILIAYFFVFATLLYKAQIFVAISYLALVLPVVFMGGRILKVRFACFMGLTIIFLISIFLSQHSLKIPVMRLDGSGLAIYSGSVLGMQESGWLKNSILSIFTSSKDQWSLTALTFALLLIICTFGVFAPFYLFLSRYVQQQFGLLVVLFPVFVVAIYLLMAVGLAIDDRHIGAPEELLHRPFGWAYFVLVVWFAGALYHRLFKNSLPQNRYLQFVLVLVTCALMLVPFNFSKKIQTFVNWGLGYQELPVCQLEIAKHIRANTKVDDIVQDSLNDPRFLLSGLSERKAFAIDAGGVRSPIGIKLRLEQLRQLKQFTSASQVDLFMSEHKINWYVANPLDPLQWAGDQTHRIAFKCENFALYKF